MPLSINPFKKFWNSKRFEFLAFSNKSVKLRTSKKEFAWVSSMQGSSSQLATFLMIFPLFVYSGFKLYIRDNVKAIVTITYLKCQQERSKLIECH